MNKSKAKGTSWESAIVNYLQQWAFKARRKVLSGAQDKGDIEIPELPYLVIEAKNEKRYFLAEYIKEVLAETENAGREIGWVWMHRQGKSDPADGYVLMDGRTAIKVLQKLKSLELS